MNVRYMQLFISRQ